MQELEGLRPYLSGKIKGQHEAIEVVASAIIRAQMGHVKRDRPKGVFLFLGPTGVGKTETAHALCDYFNQTQDNRSREPFMWRCDMAEFQRQESIDLLIGGKGDHGTLGSALERLEVGKSGVKILLFDEIEKAHPRITTLFFSALDAARITLGDGRTRNLASYYIVFTSNLGSHETVKMEHVPFATLKRHVESVAQKFFSPPLYARFGEKVVYRKLGYETQLEICRSMLEKDLKEFFGVRWKRQIIADAAVFNYLVKKGYSRMLGARPMRDVIEREIGNALSKWALNHFNITGVEPAGAGHIHLKVDEIAESGECLYVEDKLGDVFIDQKIRSLVSVNNANI
ncbi:MAG: AAA family ATPase [Verrucomicrobiota bacterium]|nr:AAA family ATPase [Verrucomicrobiota bacterium]